jgi:hypothetical protein
MKVRTSCPTADPGSHETIWLFRIQEEKHKDKGVPFYSGMTCCRLGIWVVIMIDKTGQKALTL